MVARLPGPEPQAPVKPRRRLRVRRPPVSVLPTLLTLANVLCGFLAVFWASRPADAAFPFDWTPLTFAAMAVFAGMVFDGFDGRVARLTHSTSALGEQLDSMADMVTFGVAPAFIAVQLVNAGVPFIADSADPAAGDHLFGRTTLAVALIYVACAALRLARYTVEARDKPANNNPNVFAGLPSPGAAGTVAALALLQQHALHPGNGYPEDHWLIVGSRYAMVGVTLLTALAMISKLPYTHIMNRYLRDRARVGTIAMYVVVALLLLVVPQWTLAIGFVGYACSAPARQLIARLARA